MLRIYQRHDRKKCEFQNHSYCPEYGGEVYPDLCIAIFKAPNQPMHDAQVDDESLIYIVKKHKQQIQMINQAESLCTVDLEFDLS